MNKEKRKNRYDFHSMSYVTMYYNFHQGMLISLAQAYEKKLKDAGFSQGKILDAGCAFGGLSMHLVNAFPLIECIGVDFSQNQIDFASQLAKEAPGGERITFVKADVHHLPFEDNSFDAVFNLNVAHIVDDPVQMFNEFERVLKPEGVLFIKDLRKTLFGSAEEEIRYSFTAEEARELISQSKLRKGKFSTSSLWWNYEII
ncbi:MAG: class I SAM-dependent methyltransferase [Bacillota bacterium]